ncbi:MAG: hypothetical protein ACRYF0_06430 [Janthinobacterium lividum]
MKILILSAIILSAASCSSGNTYSCSDRGVLEINNLMLREHFVNYAKENRLDLKNSVITVEISRIDTVDYYLISSSKSNPFEYKNKPFAYSNVNNIWVVFFNKYQNPFDTNEIERDFLRQLKENKVFLSNGLIFHNPKYLELRVVRNIVIGSKYLN